MLKQLRVFSLLLFTAISIVISFSDAFTQSTYIENTVVNRIDKGYSAMGFYFTENIGQFKEKALYKADVGGVFYYFYPNEVVCLFVQKTDDLIGGASGKNEDLPFGFQMPKQKLERLAISAKFIGANPQAVFYGDGRLPHNNNYFLGNDPAAWYTDIPNYSSIIYENIYPEIDLKYYGHKGSMKHDFIVSPGADPSLIRIEFDGIDNLSLSESGELKVQTEFGLFQEKAPYIYQEIGGQNKQISGGYKLFEPGVYGFDLGDYDRSLPLIIDPEFVQGSFLGGSSWDEVMGVAVDGAGAMYVVGMTYSLNFPLEDPYQDEHQGAWEVYVSKIAPSGDHLIYSTFIGGNYIDYGFDIAVDDYGHAFIIGNTQSNDFPTVNAIDSIYNGGPSGDAFVAKLSLLGNSLIFSTFLGGSGYDEARDIAIDSRGNACIVGKTLSFDFPIFNAIDEELASSEAFLTKISSNGSSLLFSTFWGGSHADNGWGIAIDNEDNIYIVGETRSIDFPLVNPCDGFEPSFLREGFVSKLSGSGDSIIYSTYLGGSYGDEAFSIDTDDFGNAYVTGFTASYDFPIVNAFDSTINGSDDVFITKLPPTGGFIEYSTFFGGGAGDYGRSIAVNLLGEVYVAGTTSSGNIPLVNPFDGTYGAVRDAFLIKLSESGSTLLYSTYIGGEGKDDGHDMDLDDFGRILIGGKTNSEYGFPAVNGFDSYYNGGEWDGFLIEFSEGQNVFSNVWPGDLDNNGIVNAEDILPIAEYWYETGPSRGIIDYNWYGHEVLEWNIPSATFADGDGNGRIDVRDLFPICLNWNLTHDGIIAGQSLANSFNIEYNKEALEAIYEQVKDAHVGPQYEIKIYLEELLNMSIPNRIALFQNFPNPFNLSTSIGYYLSIDTEVNLVVFNIAGQSVKTLVSSSQQKGNHEIIWDGRDDAGRIVSSGIYFYSLETSGSSYTNKMLLLK